MYYKDLEKKIEDCQQCDIKTTVEINKKFGSTFGYGGKYFMICGLAPSYKRNEIKYPLSLECKGGTGGLLFKALDEVKWPIDQTYFTNIIKCSLPDNRIPEEIEINNCFNTFFKQELLLVNPFVIVALGKKVYEFLKINLDQFEYPVYGIKHFSYISRNPNEYNTWVKSLESVKEKAMERLKNFRIV